MIKVANIYNLLLRLPIWTIKVAKLLIIKMANMNIKGSQDGRIILLRVNRNTNYEIVLLIHYFVR